MFDHLDIFQILHLCLNVIIKIKDEGGQGGENWGFGSVERLNK